MAVTYVESQADHDFSAFLASLTSGRVLKDRTANFSPVERKRQKFLTQKGLVEAEVRRVRAIQDAVQLAGLMKTN